MRKVSEIIYLIEKFAPLAMAATWDKSGIQVASAKENVERLAVMLDPTPDALQKAVEAGADMVLAHHPLAMQPRFLDTLGAYHKAVSLLLRFEIPLYSAHTSLDTALGGPVSWLGNALALQNITPLEEIAPAGLDTTLPYGFGFYGDLQESLPYTVFVRRLTEALGRNFWTACGPEIISVRRIACCPGSGSSYAEAAHAVEADILITGDVKYHSALEAPLRILDVGHFILEYTMMRLFSEKLAKELPDIDIIFIPASDPFAMEQLNTEANII